MTTITVLATSPEIAPIANRTVLTGSAFTAGELPVANDVQINVLLHDVSNRLVGLGEAPELVDIVGDEKKTLTIPVRKPFIYASSGTGSALYTFDPTIDPRMDKFQGRISGLTSPVAGVSVGGDRFVVAGGTSLQVIETATHKVIGNPITVPGTVSDIAPVPGIAKVAVAHSAGIAIVDLATGQVANAPVAAMVDSVTVGPAGDGRMVAYGLVGRVAPPDLPQPLGQCTGSSSVVAVFVDAPAATAPKPLGGAVASIASAPAQAAVFAALPCTGQVARIEGDPTSEVATLTLTAVSPLQGAAVVAVQGDRVFAAGTQPSTPSCQQGTCNSMSTTACPDPLVGNKVSWVSEGARLIVQSIPIGAGTKLELVLPERRETMVNTDDMASSHAQVMHPMGTVPLDIVVLPGGQYVSVVMRNNYYVESLYDQLNALYILPCLKATSADWQLVDLASSSIGQRVRTSCMITAIRTGSNVYFPNWKCDDAPVGEQNSQGADYLPTSVGALFGAR